MKTSKLLLQIVTFAMVLALVAACAAPAAALATPAVTLAPLPAGMKHRFHAMVKPIGSTCNLSCAYCYYLHKEELLKQTGVSKMSAETLEQHIRQYIEAQTGDEVVFSWQGGEPTLLGLDFFRRVVALENGSSDPQFRRAITP